MRGQAVSARKHRCFELRARGEEGTVIARIHGDPRMSKRASDALMRLVKAAYVQVKSASKRRRPTPQESKP